MWDFSVIKALLMNPVYTGAIASKKKDYRFKIGTIGAKMCIRDRGTLRFPCAGYHQLPFCGLAIW